MRWGGAKESPACPCVSLGAVWGDGLSGGYLPAGPDFSSSGVVAASIPFSQAGWGVFCSSLKNGVFLTVPEVRNSANATGTPHVATASAAFVRQVAKGGRIPDFRGSKKYLRFFQWSRKHPHPAWEKGRLATTTPEEEKSGPAGRYPPDRPSPHTAPGRHRDTQDSPSGGQVMRGVRVGGEKK